LEGGTLLDLAELQGGGGCVFSPSYRAYEESR
jgi:hypothetical protein